MWNHAMAKARLFVRFVVPGVAQPRGSKTIGRKCDGSSFIRDDNPESKRWMSTVSKAAKAAMSEHNKRPTGKPVLLMLTVYRTRPKGHFGTGRNASQVKASAPAYPATKPDTTKLVRGIEDALNEIVWTDDAIVVEQRTSKRWGAVPRVEIAVYELPMTVAELGQQSNMKGGES
jgi:Holliday junction resolvase RusA-like endonuclease